ncbi:TetR/AcrR family transcriptional regulator [Youngiibacter fragilis]|uniref:HTH tetR-type domain-containing protein n=1 Tax=Youngiibacter fragilis 232.1 TaxID=994573 RepID=V7I1E6_9CLOT|nr:TetR/AcrR family transcriptional regulator [Youngiibacter fragilis]ETA80070.1 hypothetical protein T472_0213650 [Youngiibacter fragilis 232.1]
MSNTESMSKRFEILDCAIELFRKEGYSNVTINQICAAANVSKTTFYYYYKSKDSLIADFYSKTNYNVKEQLLSILSADNELDQLWNICDMYIQPISDAGPEIVRELYINNMKKDVLAIAPRDIYMKDVMITLMKRAKSSGKIQNPASAEELYETLVYLIDGVAFIWATKNGGFDILAESRKVFDTLLVTQIE